jgi:hypothetical protein
MRSPFHQLAAAAARLAATLAVLALAAGVMPAATQAAPSPTSAAGLGPNPWIARELTAEDLTPSLEAAARFLVRRQLPTGEFHYIVDPLGTCCRPNGDAYSMIRHLGAVYALLRAYEIAPVEDFLTAARRGLEFAARFRDDDGVLRGPRGGASFGDNGYFVLDTVLYDALSGTRRFAVAADDVADFLQENLVYGGPLSTSAQWAECQAAIGLIAYYKHRRQDTRLPLVVRRWLDRMMAAGKSSHWSTQAIFWLDQAGGGAGPALVNYALETSRKLLDQVATRAEGVRTRWVGGRVGRFASCNATARNEALIAAQQIARAHHRDDDAHFYVERVHEHLAYAMQFQYGAEGGLDQGFPTLARLAGLFDLRGGIFNSPSEAYVRIDFVSHHIRAISAFLRSPAAVHGPTLKMEDLEAAATTIPARLHRRAR